MYAKCTGNENRQCKPVVRRQRSTFQSRQAQGNAHELTQCEPRQTKGKRTWKNDAEDRSKIDRDGRTLTDGQPYRPGPESYASAE